MRKFIALFIVLMFLPLLAQAANQVDPVDFGKLVKVVKEQDQDISKITNILKGMDIAISALQNKGATPAPAPRSQGQIQGGTTIINDQDNQARRIGNRALAWAIKSQITCSTGNSPDIEDIEKMLTPIVKGNMEPKSFENALADALKKRGWKLVNPGTPLSKDEITQICNDAIAKTLKELTEKVKKLEDELADVKKIAQDAKKTAGEAKGLAETASSTAVTASDTATKAAATAAGIKTVDMKEVEATAKATAEATATALIPTDFVTQAELKKATDCLETKINAAKADAEATSQALTRAFNTNDKDKARFGLYASLMERYQRRGYKGDSVHGMVQVYLRACYWTEDLIEKVAKANGAKLVDVNQITPPAEPAK